MNVIYAIVLLYPLLHLYCEKSVVPQIFILTTQKWVVVVLEVLGTYVVPIGYWYVVLVVGTVVVIFNFIYSNGNGSYGVTCNINAQAG